MYSLRKDVDHMRYFYDCEFIEDGRTIDLISIGIVSEDGRELYLIDGDAPWDRIREHAWLMANVVPHLPQGNPSTRPAHWLCDLEDRHVATRGWIADSVRDFLTRPAAPVELWGYYGAYDHVLLAQLFGAMVDLPRGIPMWTNDVQQEAARLGLDSSLPPQTGTAHNALDDALWTREAWRYLNSREGSA